MLGNKWKIDRSYTQRSNLTAYIVYLTENHFMNRQHFLSPFLLQYVIVNKHFEFFVHKHLFFVFAEKILLSRNVLIFFQSPYLFELCMANTNRLTSIHHRWGDSFLLLLPLSSSHEEDLFLFWKTQWWHSPPATPIQKHEPQC